MGKHTTTLPKPFSDLYEPLLGAPCIAEGVSASAWPLGQSQSSSIPLRATVLRPNEDSRPVFTADPLSVKANPTSRAISFALHAVILSLVLVMAAQVRTSSTKPLPMTTTPINFTPYIPPITMTVSKPTGGGGGAHQVVQARKGSPAVTIARVRTLTLQAPRIERPKMVAEPAEQINIPDKNNLPSFGVSQTPQVALASHAGPSGSGFSHGVQGGIGSGRSNGTGAGTGGGYGGGVMSVGGGVTAPQVVHAVEPEFTEEARRANYQGVVSLWLIVDTQGNPQSVRVTRHLGMGLDEKAMDAVRKYKFKPAIYQGHPVSVQILIDVAFHLH